MSILAIIISLLTGIFLGRYFDFNKNRLLGDTLEVLDKINTKAHFKIISPTQLKEKKDLEKAFKDQF